MFTFDLPTRRGPVVRKIEKYNFPVVTTTAFEGKGTNRSFMFNKHAVAALAIVAKSEEPGKEQPQPMVAFAFGTGEDKQVFILNSSNIDNPKALRYSVTSNKVSDRPIFDYVNNSFGLDETVENEFSLVDTGENVNGNIVFELVLLTPEQKATAKDVSSNALSKAEDAFEVQENTEEFSLGNVPGPVEDREEVAVNNEQVVQESNATEGFESNMEDPFALPTINAGDAFEAPEEPSVLDDEFFI